MSRTQFQVVRHLLQNKEWDYFQFVEIGLDRIHHGFWKYHDPQHVLHEPDQPVQARRSATITATSTRRSASVLELLDRRHDRAGRLRPRRAAARRRLLRQRVAGPRGAARPEQLPREGHAVRASSTWTGRRRKVWSEGGYYARVFFNVKGREPQGAIEPADYERFRDEIKAKFEATADPEGKPLGTLVFKPEEIYQHGPERRPRPDRPLRRPGLAVDRRRRLPDDPRPGERHRARTTATTPSSARSSWRRRTARSRARSRAPTCWTSRRPCWSWAATRSPTSMQGRSLVAGAVRRPADGGYAARRRDDRPRPAERAGIHRLKTTEPGIEETEKGNHG